MSGVLFEGQSGEFVLTVRRRVVLMTVRRSSGNSHVGLQTFLLCSAAPQAAPAQMSRCCWTSVVPPQQAEPLQTERLRFQWNIGPL